jgi:hypothetical protein
MPKITLTKEQIADNIRDIVMAYGRAETSNGSSIPPRTLDSYLSGESEPKVSKALAIAKTVNTTVEYLVLREGPKTLGGAHNKGGSNDYELSLREPRPSYSSNTLNATEELRVAVDARMSKEELSADKVIMVKVDSEGMASIKKGDLALVNTASTQFISGALFLFDYMGNQLIREVHLVPGQGWLLKTDNPQFQDHLVGIESIQDDLKIKGQIISVSKFF